jgi:hypothetical protein
MSGVVESPHDLTSWAKWAIHNGNPTEQLNAKMVLGYDVFGPPNSPMKGRDL